VNYQTACKTNSLYALLSPSLRGKIEERYERWVAKGHEFAPQPAVESVPPPVMAG